MPPAPRHAASPRQPYLLPALLCALLAAAGGDSGAAQGSVLPSDGPPFESRHYTTGKQLVETPLARPERQSTSLGLREQGYAQAAKQLVDAASRHSAATCSAFGRIRHSRRNARFSQAGGEDEILTSLLKEYCGLTPRLVANLSLPAALYIEVGSHDAQRIAQAVSLGCRVVSFEPSPKAHGKISSEIASRGFTDAQARVIKKAVSDVSGKRLFRVGTQSGTGGGDALVGQRSQYEPGSWWHSTASFNEVEVEVTSLDDALLAAEPLIPVMSIDVRGWEHRALLGAKALVDSHRIQALLFRLWPVGVRDADGGRFARLALASLLKHLHRRGYHLFQTRLSSIHLPPADLPDAPECPLALLDFLDESEMYDGFGLWTTIVAVKT